MEQRIIVIGGGAAGMMAALIAAENGGGVILLEKNEKLGKKIYITGKGRCNFTNVCDFQTFIGNVVTNPKFLYSSLRAFSPEDMLEFLEVSGCRTKVERGNRAFPISDHASDVTAALAKRMKAAGVEVVLETEVRSIEPLGERKKRDDRNDGIDDRKGNSDDRNTGRMVSLSENTYDIKLPSEKKDMSADTIGSAEKCGADSNGADSSFRVTARNLRNGRKAVYEADSVIIATGGLSYPSTGSTGDGYRFAAGMGHACSALKPALVPLCVAEQDFRVLQGVSLRNVSVTLRVKEKVLMESEPGELLFTHFGLSGPLVLSASSLAAAYLEPDVSYLEPDVSLAGTSSVHEVSTREPSMYEPPKHELPMRDAPMREPSMHEPSMHEPPMREPAHSHSHTAERKCQFEKNGVTETTVGRRVVLSIDLKPGLTPEMLDARIRRDFEGAQNQNVGNALGRLLISSLRPVVLARAGIPMEKKVRDITKKERERLIEIIKHLDYTVTGTRGYQEAIVTQGGVAVSDIHPKTMESKTVPGLYFAGEVLDVDAFTGGFNLQIAWSTGRAAGLAAANIGKD